MTTENTRLRSEFLNTQVIARNTGKRLGVVKDILVDMDRREVVALGLRDNLLSVSGIPKYMYLSSICQTGDVILVEDADAIEDIDIELYSKLVKCEVVTETNQPLGRVRDFQFSAEDGKLQAITIAALGIPQIPDQLVSTYELSIDDVVTSGPDRLIVFEGAEERLTQVTVGLLERLGLGSPAWEKEPEYYPKAVEAKNMLGSGAPERPPIETPIEARRPVMEEERWEEDWQESRVAPPPMQQQARAIPDDYYEEDNWGGEEPEDVYDAPSYESVAEVEDNYSYSDAGEDMWDDDESPQPYNPQPVNIPQKQVEKIPEYEEEPG